MAGFSATEAALTGFRVVREHPRAVIVWALLQLAVSLTLGTVVIVLVGDRLLAVESAGALTTPAGQAAVFDFVNRYWPLYLGMAAFAVVYYAILFAAMNRAVLQPYAERFGFLRLGPDELRQAGLILLLMLAATAAEAAAILFMFAVSLAFALVSREAAAAGGAIGGLVALGALIVAAVRLSLASPLTYASRRIDLLGSWALTRGRVWPMLGVYLLSLSLTLLIGLLGEIIITAAVVVIGGLPGLSAMLHGADMSPAALLSPTRLASVALGSALAALVWPVVLTPPIEIYRRLNQG